MEKLQLPQESDKRHLCRPVPGSEQPRGAPTPFWAVFSTEQKVTRSSLLGPQLQGLFSPEMCSPCERPSRGLEVAFLLPGASKAPPGLDGGENSLPKKLPSVS